MKKLLLTSPEGYAQRLLQAFRERPARQLFHPVSRPMIRTSVMLDSPGLKTFLSQVETVDYVAFSSRKAIEAFAQGWAEEGRPLPSSVGWCAIGKDNDLLRELLQVEPSFLAEEPSPKGIVSYLERLPDTRGKRIAVLAPQVVGMEEPSIVPDFLTGLAAIGMVPVRINVYRTQAVSEDVLRDTAREIQQGTYDAVVFTSGTEVQVFLQMVPEGESLENFLGPLTVICYGPYTAGCARAYGVKVDFTSTSFGAFQGLVEQIENYYQTKK